MPAEEPSGATLVIRRFCGATVGGILQGLCSHPFDTMKSRVQNGTYPNLTSCIKGTVQKEGPLAFYKGLLPPLSVCGIYNSVLFSVNQFFTVVMTPSDMQRGDRLPLWRTAVAAQLTAPFAVLAYNPMEVIKIRLQVQQGGGKDRYRGMFDCLRQTIKESGPQGLLRGFFPTLGTRVVGLPFYFGTYETVNGMLCGDLAREEAPYWIAPVGGTCAGIMFWVSNYPLDYLKTRVQVDVNSGTPSQIVREVYKKSGIRGFYKGFVPCMLRAIPANASVWCGVDITTKFMIAKGW